MRFKEVAAKYLGRDSLAHMHDDGVEDMLKQDPATLRAEMNITPDEFQQILEQYTESKVSAVPIAKKKVINVFGTKEGEEDEQTTKTDR